MKSVIKPTFDCNTISIYSQTIWRAFIGEKLFISENGHTCFNSYDEALEAVFNSNWMKAIKEYVDYSAKFFEEETEEWKKGLLKEILEHQKLSFEEYEFNDNYVDEIKI